ncbi:MAG: phosphatidate cytidylyltransferase [Calditrichia bacterium]
MKELWIRVLMSFWGIPLILGLSYFGGYFFLLLVTVINGFALWEFYTIYSHRSIFAHRNAGVILASVFLITIYFLPIHLLLSAVLITLLLFFLRHLRVTQPLPSTNTVFTISGFIYITLFLATLLKLRQNFAEWTHPGDLYSGGRFIILLFISIWICDTMAYFGGRLLGRHKFAPNTSPNKTIEGALFGLAGAVLVFVLLGPLLAGHLSQWYFWICGLIVGIFGQLGDLVESRFKRDAGVKDTSTLLPGHGGFLDRFDSLIFVSPFFFLLFYH